MSRSSPEASSAATDGLSAVATEPQGDALEQLGELLASMLELTGMLNHSIDVIGAGRFKSNADLILMTSLRLDGPSRPSDVLEATQMTSGGLTNLVDRLEAAGTVRRMGTVEHDRRGVWIALTPVGEDTIDGVARAARGVLVAARPLLEHFRERFTEMGLSVGRSAKPVRGDRGALEQLRRIVTVGQTFRAVYLEVFGPHDSNPSATHHALWLGSRPGGTRPSSIARATRLSTASTTDLLDRMQERGLVVREASSTDRRGVVVTSTELGRASLQAIVAKAAPLMPPFAEAFFPS